MREVDTLTVWADSGSDTVEVEFDVRNLNYALSRQPEHCREPDAYGKWVWSEWETRSGKPSYSIRLYAEDSVAVYVEIYCRGDEPGNRSVLFDWGDRRPMVPDDAFEVTRSDGTLHSSSHPVRVRYGAGIPQSESWQLFSKEASSGNRSLPAAYVGDAAGKVSQYREVDTLTVWTDVESGETIHAEFDVRRLGKGLARLDQHCR